jgi:hypothetical protein
MLPSTRLVMLHTYFVSLAPPTLDPTTPGGNRIDVPELRKKLNHNSIPRPHPLTLVIPAVHLTASLGRHSPVISTMFRSLAPRAVQRATRPVSNSTFCASNIYFQNRLRRGYASEAGESCCYRASSRTCADCSAEEKDLVIIGGGVAGYVAAIKAGQAGMKVSQMNI